MAKTKKPQINAGAVLARTAGLTAGGAGTAIVQAQIIPKVLPKASRRTSNLVTGFLGLGISIGTPFLQLDEVLAGGFQGVGDGMVSVSAANLLIDSVPQIAKLTVPPARTQGVRAAGDMLVDEPDEDIAARLNQQAVRGNGKAKNAYVR